MAKPYAAEIAKLEETFSWACQVDIAPLQSAIKTAGLSSLLAIGSGGSLSAAHIIAGLHQNCTGHLASVATPLDAVAERLNPTIALWLLSAGGGNVDILRAFDALSAREPRQLGILCGNSRSRLADAARKHPYTDLVTYEPPSGKDGFLATNSLLAFSTLLTRAYFLEFSTQLLWDECARATLTFLRDEQLWKGWKSECRLLWKRATTIVLHGTTERVGAIDLESKFTEAALGNLQISDFRNFAHGRHHWLAKRQSETGIVAFVTKSNRSLASRTISLVPKNTPRVLFMLEVPDAAAPLCSLIAALSITAWAGEARGIDPGRPGVPEFGRKLYSLPFPRAKKSKSNSDVSPSDAQAILRKCGTSSVALRARGELDQWTKSLHQFKRHLSEAKIDSLVIDYDGTIIDTRHRYDLPNPEITDEIARIAALGISVAIATGRGASVRRDLQKRLPADLWPRILIGYYNGAEISPLADNSCPDGREGTCEELAPLAKALREQPELAASVEQTDRQFQITLQAKWAMPENRLWDLAHEVMLMTNSRTIRTTRSSHSVDIVAGHVSKTKVTDTLRNRGQTCILTIGDRGRWPGNDYELLREKLALSVDEVSVDPSTCWNLAPIGQRGPSATLTYLRCLRSDGNYARFDIAGLE